MSDLQRTHGGELTPQQLLALQQFNDQADEIRSMDLPPARDLPEMDLDAELDDLAAMVQEQTPEPEPVPIQEEIRNDILALLRGKENAPSADQIEMWKQKYGSDAIQLLGLDQDNVYIYTHINLPQWEKINELVAKAQGTPMQDKIQGMIREKVIRTAVLWPTLEPRFFQTCRAGLPDTLYQLIMIHSYFLTPQQAMTLTTQL